MHQHNIILLTGLMGSRGSGDPMDRNADDKREPRPNLIDLSFSISITSSGLLCPWNYIQSMCWIITYYSSVYPCLACGWNFSTRPAKFWSLRRTRTWRMSEDAALRGRSAVAASQSTKENKKCDVAPQHVIICVPKLLLRPLCIIPPLSNW